MAKTNIRSFRYSDRVADLLEQQQGSSLNEKFENLVLFSSEKVPQVERELVLLQDQIDVKRKKYYDLCARLSEVTSLIGTLEQLRQYGETVAQQVKAITENEL